MNISFIKFETQTRYDFLNIALSKLIFITKCMYEAWQTIVFHRAVTVSKVFEQSLSFQTSGSENHRLYIDNNSTS